MVLQEIFIDSYLNMRDSIYLSVILLTASNEKLSSFMRCFKHQYVLEHPVRTNEIIHARLLWLIDDYS